MGTSLLPPREYLPPEQVLDEYHPHNSEFFRQQQQLKFNIRHIGLGMKPYHIQAVKLHLRGEKNVDIAAELGLTPNTVSQILARQDVRNLKAAMLQLNALNDGPSIEHRKNKLWQIAVNNEAADPKTSISAIAEMNKMDGIGKDASIKINPGDKGVVFNMNFGPPLPPQPKIIEHEPDPAGD